MRYSFSLFTSLFLLLNSYSTAAAEEVFIDAPSGYYLAGNNPVNVIHATDPGLKTVDVGQCRFLSSFDATRIEWSGGCAGGFIAGNGDLTLFGSDNLIKERLSIGEGTEFFLDAGAMFWDHRHDFSVDFVNPTQHGSNLIAGVMINVQDDFNVQNFDSREYLRLKGFSVFNEYATRIPGLKKKKPTEILVMIRSARVRDGTGNAQIFMSPDGVVIKIDSRVMRHKEQEIERLNRDIRAASAQDQQIRFRQEAEIKVKSDTASHEKSVSEELDKDRTNLKLADLLHYSRTKAIAKLSSGMTVAVQVSNSGFASGFLLVEWKETARDIVAEVREEYKDRIRENWDDWFKMTQGDPFGRLYTFRCAIPMEAATSITDGEVFQMHVKLDSMQDNRVSLVCTPEASP